MRHQNPLPVVLQRLLTEARTIAVVGASSNPARPSHGVMKKLIAVGYRVIPVNPGETEVLGIPAYPSLAAIPEDVDIVDVFRRADATPPIADQAVAKGARAFWLQAGIINDDAAARAAAGGLIVIMDACIAVEHSLLGIPPKMLHG